MEKWLMAGHLLLYTSRGLEISWTAGLCSFNPKPREPWGCFPTPNRWKLWAQNDVFFFCLLPMSLIGNFLVQICGLYFVDFWPPRCDEFHRNAVKIWVHKTCCICVFWGDILAWEISHTYLNISQEGKLIFGEAFCNRKFYLLAQT